MNAADWEAGEDVRLLSLRLQQLATSSEGLAWDEPSVPLGSTDASDAAATSGIQPVRTGGVPANIEVRMTGAQEN
jgi:hypothetical protein